MKIKGVAIAAAGFAIASAVPLVASAHDYSWWAKPRKVIVTKPVTIDKVKVGYPLYKSHVVKESSLKRGDIITVNHMASYDWSVQKKGYAHNSYYFWMLNYIFKPTWITPYSRTWVNWNQPMTKHAYVRKTSKAYVYAQPGKQKVHYLKNYPKTTWYTSRHAKIASGAIYYYVTSGNGKAHGWIWRGNLKSVASKAKPSTVTASQPTTEQYSVGSDDYDDD